MNMGVSGADVTLSLPVYASGRAVFICALLHETFSYLLTMCSGSCAWDVPFSPAE